MTGYSAPLLTAEDALLSGALPESVGDTFSILSETLTVVREQALPLFGVALLVGLALAAAGWAGAIYFARLWNRRYHPPPWQHALCGIAALATFAAAPVWAATAYVKNTTQDVRQVWQDRFPIDRTWQEATYAEAYETVERLGTERLDGVPRPGESGSRIPLTDSASVQAVANVYAQRTTAQFREKYPYLSTLAHRARTGRLAGTETWTTLQQSGALRPLTQPARQAIAATAAHVLDPVLLWVWRVRLTTGGLVFALHLLTFGVVGVLAARDIRIH